MIFKYHRHVLHSLIHLQVCAHRWKDAKFVARSDLLYMQGLCYELDSNFQTPARLIPILVDYNSLVHTIERYPIWAYGALGQSVQYTKVCHHLHSLQLQCYSSLISKTRRRFETEHFVKKSVWM